MTGSLARHRGVLAGAILLVTVGVAGSAVADPSPNPEDVLKGSLVWNGSFDVADQAAHPLGWSVEGDEAGATVVNLADYRTSGLTSLEVTDKAGSNVYVRSDRVPALAGASYTASAKVKGREGTPAWLYLEFWGMERGAPPLASKRTEPAPGTAWQDATVSAVAPEGTVQVTALVYGSIATAGVSYWDEVRVEVEPAPYDPAVGTERELFVDGYRIEELSDVDRVVHPGVTDPLPVIRADKPWEKTVYYTSLVRKGSSYELFYTCYNDQAPNYHICLAESDDFVNWRKPVVGLIPYEGDKNNNIVWAGGGSVTYNPNAPAESRYRMMTFKQEPFGYHGLSSPDGRVWTPVSGEPLLPGGDVVNVTYDAASGQYVATFKDRLFTSRTPGIYDRSAFIATSTDFLTWSPKRLAVSGDVADDGAAAGYGGVEGQIYGMPVLRYGNQYLGLPWRFLITDYTSGEYKTAADGPVLPGIVASRDLVRWDRSSRGPLIEPGRPGSWNDGTLYSGNDVHVTGGEVAMLYGGFNTWHGGAIAEGPSRKVQHASIGRAVWRRDGFVSLTNGAAGDLGDPGTVTTKPLAPTAPTPHVNARLDDGGSLAIEVLDAATGEPLDGFAAGDMVPITGDQLDAPVRWTGGALPDREIELRFHLTGGDLYSFWFA